MKKSPRWFLLPLAFLAASVGCQSLDLSPETDPERAVAGTITLNSDVAFPPDAELVVRVLDLTPSERLPMTTGVETAVVARSPSQPTERVLGQQVIRAPGAKPIPFRVEFHADDTTLRRGLNIDARISQGGKVTHRSLNAHMITLSSLQFSQEVQVDPVR